MGLIAVPVCGGCFGINAAMPVGAQHIAGTGTCSGNAGCSYFIKATYGLAITFSPLYKQESGGCTSKVGPGEPCWPTSPFQKKSR